MLKNWIMEYCWPLVAMAGAILAIIITVQHFTIVKNDADIATKDATISELSFANTALKASVDEQNKAIIAMKTEEEDRARRAAAALADAAKTQKSYEDSATRIETMPVAGDECTAAHTLLTQYTKGLHP